jgi:hypothetical protein
LAAPITLVAADDGATGVELWRTDGRPHRAGEGHHALVENEFWLFQSRH